MSEQIQVKRELVTPGHYGCPGCGATVAMQQTLSVLGEDTIVVMTAGCWSSLIGIYPYTCITVPVVSVAFGATASVAAGIKAGLTIQGNDHTTVLAFAGDGGTFDIGFQPLSGVVERNDDILFICYDNEAYMNTGVQRSSATPFGAATTTSPAGKATAGQLSWKKNMPGIAVAHNIPYVATASPSYPFDMMEKIKKAVSIKGPSYIQVLSVCPTGWRCAPDLSVRMGRLAVETGVFPLYEVEYGQYKMSIETPTLRPLADYTKIQGRFRHLSEDQLKVIQSRVELEYNKLVEKAKKK